MNAILEGGAIAPGSDAESPATASAEHWWTFQQVNRDRRAIRDFLHPAEILSRT